MKVEFHPHTITDLNRAVNYYEERKNGLGVEFRSQVYRTINEIETTPNRFRKVKGEIRRCFVRRFPYSVLFRIVKNKTIRILVIRHHRQKVTYGVSDPLR